MGLKTTNYNITMKNLLLPEAYAIFDNIKKIGTNHFRAYFKVQSTRENAENCEALEVKTVDFTWDRKTDLVAMAYAASKKQVEFKIWNEETSAYETVTRDGIFTGWEDDIVTE